MNLIGKIFKNIILLIFLVLFTIPTKTLFSRQIEFRKLTTNDGLSHYEVFQVLQDKRRFMWFANRDGLNKYDDGYHFTKFMNDLDDSTSIINNDVRCMLEDSEGKLWLGTLNGLCLFDPEQDRFSNFYNHEDYPQGFIRTIIEDRQKNIWIGTWGDGLYKYNQQSNNFTHYPKAKNNKKTVNDQNIFCLLNDSQNR